MGSRRTSSVSKEVLIVRRLPIFFCASVSVIGTLTMTSSAEKPPFKPLCEQFDYTPKGRPLVTDEVAAILSAKRNTLEQYRLKGIGPKFDTPPGT